MSIVVRPVSQQAYELMRERILGGSLEAGSPVRQDTIALELGISKIPLREALTRLIEDGLVVSHPNRGFVVSLMTREEAQEVFLLRLKLEPEATVQGSLAATSADHQRIKTALKALEAALRTSGSAYVALNRLFHMAMIQPGVGQVTYHMLERLHLLAERYVRIHLEPTGRTKRAITEHRTLMAAWIEGDTKILLELSMQHIENTLRDLRVQLAARLEAPASILPGVDFSAPVPRLKATRRRSLLTA